jgi:hypothetical protein
MATSIADVAREKLGTSTPGGELIDEIIGSKQNKILVGVNGPDRLIAGKKGYYQMTGNGGPDQYVLAPSDNDFDQLLDGNLLKSNNADRITGFSHLEGDTLVLGKQSFQGINPKNYAFEILYTWKNLNAASSKGNKNKILAKVEDEYSFLFYDSNGGKEGFGDNGGRFANLGVNFSLQQSDILFI